MENKQDNKLETIDDIAVLRFLEDEDIDLTKTEGGFLSLKIGEEEEYKRIALQRAFPLSRPNEYITIREVNDKRELGKEIGIILNIEDISPEKRRLIEDELDLRYHTPVVLQVYSLRDEYGYIYMNVNTTAGKKNITVPNSSNNFIRLSDIRVLIIDMDGNRFEIPDYKTLDPKSVRLLETVI
ncbi:MAG TPA: DUF1854 domain-containing protein [Clostridiaceae bacterium]|jgi:hypothetical protein|nr:DUF1854 domain-containing protein [Clostridiaceae bacterium]HOA32657.1 DUF1854 domain-containing protein [Clostridia bacterium]